MADNTINITKVSGVIAVTSGTNPPKYFYGATGTFTQTPNGTGYLVTIGGQSFTIPLATLRVNGQAATNITNGASLLSAIFAT